MKVGLYAFGKNHAIDKYFQILGLFDLMIKDERYSPVILTDGTGMADKDLHKIYDGVVDFIDLRENDINQLDLSFILIIDPYNKPCIPYSEIKVPIVYKEYGVAGVEKGAGFLLKKDVYKYADCIITENPYMESLILKEHPRLKSDQVLVGSPAFDYIFQEMNVDSRFDDEHVHVLWTPHHSIVSNPGYDNIVGGTYSTFMTYKDYFHDEFLREFPEIVLHIKPHPLLRGRYNHHFGKFSEYLRTFSHPDRVFVHEKESYHPLFMQSQFIINDSISFVQEWLPTGKPMIVLDDDNKAPYSPWGENLIDNCYYRSKSVEDLKRIVKYLLDGYDHLERSRQVRAQCLYMSSMKSNSEELLDTLYSRYIVKSWRKDNE